MPWMVFQESSGNSDDGCDDGEDADDEFECDCTMCHNIGGTYQMTTVCSPSSCTDVECISADDKTAISYYFTLMMHLKLRKIFLLFYDTVLTKSILR